ncbi:50S ribosomal protein L28 [Mobilicoccus pelagius]|uniref:Large ribosomal subunit protein bL28 n=1 Tax=Mobilicoccus pelagius NBRC 104925 TaxID=1089455 RepID=H5UNX8_9MICO|nr:50S ribosomal protein L28 [Mobilicoccus pelagius]GAB47436.1 50S ribosomal protein L28 [Mobilicoccus pelagius NBRC 104925]
MSARCRVTGREPTFGRTISHSHRRSPRRFDPNVQRKTYWAPSLGRKVTLRLSTKGIGVVDRRGIDAVVADLLARGEKI